MHALSTFRSRSTVPVLLTLALALLTGCGGTAADEEAAFPPAEQFALPDWIEQVHPDPAAEASPTPEVQVVHAAVGVREGVRLVVDGTDVTEYADVGRGVLTYDPNRPEAPVALEPGEHEASAIRVSLDEFGDQHEVLDRYDWRFTVQ